MDAIPDIVVTFAILRLIFSEHITQRRCLERFGSARVIEQGASSSEGFICEIISFSLRTLPQTDAGLPLRLPS